MPNSEHKGSGHHPECCHQQLTFLIALWCLGVGFPFILLGILRTKRKKKKEKKGKEGGLVSSWRPLNPLPQ